MNRTTSAIEMRSRNRQRQEVGNGGEDHQGRKNKSVAASSMIFKVHSSAKRIMVHGNRKGSPGQPAAAGRCAPNYHGDRAEGFDGKHVRTR
jgi:hypothetical protein